MTYHVLTGDALLQSLPQDKLEGSVIIIRECLIEGPVKTNTLSEFWEKRNVYLSSTYPDSDIDYENDVVFEFEKLKDLNDGDEVNLWFEHDLFCQVNFWFTLTQIPQKKLDLFRVYPVLENLERLWHGFGPLSSNELLNCLSNRIPLSKDDLTLGKNLWRAYSTSDWPALRQLSQSNSTCFPVLKEVCAAQIERISKNNQPGRPEKVLMEIVQQEGKYFEKVFSIFSEREGIYGFGDSQVRKMYDQLTR